MVKASAKVVELLVGRRWRHDAHDPGTICVHRMEEVTRYRFPQPTDANYQTALIYIPVQLLASSLDQFRRPGQSISLPRLNSIVDRDGAITQTAHALLRAMTLGEGDIYAEAAATWLAVHVLSRYGPNAGVQDNRNAGGLTDARLARVVEFMSVHFAQPLTLDRIAQEAHVSKFHFTRLFRERIGQIPYRYLAEIRLDAARRMLLTTDRSVMSVAAACGFASASNFSVAFTRKYGVSPLASRTPNAPKATGSYLISC